MNEIIPVVPSTINGQSVQTVDARALHEFLEVGRDFSSWIKDRIDTYGFVEGQDFFFRESESTEGRGGHNRKDYALTIEAARAIASAEKNEKGKQFLRFMAARSVITPRELMDLIADVDLPDAPDLFVYAIREQDTGHLKLGISKDPEERLRQLQIANSSRLEIVAIRPAPNRFSDEAAIHKLAGQYRIHGEWFDGRALCVLN